VETVRYPVPFPAEVTIALRQDPQHHPMIGALDRSETRRAHRRDGDRAGVVRVVLVRLPRPQQPHPRRQRRRHIDDALAGVDELLGEEVAEPASGLDRPRPFLERCRPSHQAIHLGLRRPNLEAGELAFAVVERDRLVGLLVRVDPDHHCCYLYASVVVGVGDRGGHS